MNDIIQMATVITSVPLLNNNCRTVTTCTTCWSISPSAFIIPKKQLSKLNYYYN
jgi:hypothetical protein